MNLLATIGKVLVPKKIRPHLRSYLETAGINREPYALFSVSFFVAILIGLFIHFRYLAPIVNDWSLIGLLFGHLFGIFLSIGIFVSVAFMLLYFYFDLVIFKRVALIEQALPDYLQLVSTNVKSGLSFEKSLWYAIKPQFGLLSLEMQAVLKKVMTGYDLSDALDDFARKYKSPMVRRAMGLLVGEIDSGGKISHIIDGLVKNLKQNQKMKAEMAASVISYMIFIGAIVIFISPLLFALSFNLLSFMDQFIGKVADAGGGSVGGIDIGEGKINLDGFRIFSQTAVMVVAFLSSLIVSIIERGDVRAGVKYIPIFVIGALFSYLVFSFILQSFFGGIAL